MAHTPIHCEQLAASFKGLPNPVEKLLADQRLALFTWLTSATTEERDDPLKGRLVQLACGHFVVTKAIRRCGCPRCGEMIRSGYDYEGFRNSGMVDDFEWPGDPLASLYGRQKTPLI